MQITIKTPELERFVEEQVKAGTYPSPEDVVSGALALLRGQAQTNAADIEELKAANGSLTRATRHPNSSAFHIRARDSRHQMRHRTHHPNEPRDRRKRQGLPSQPNHHRLQLCTCFVLFPFCSHCKRFFQNRNGIRAAPPAPSPARDRGRRAKGG